MSLHFPLRIWKLIYLVENGDMKEAEDCFSCYVNLLDPTINMIFSLACLENHRATIDFLISKGVTDWQEGLESALSGGQAEVAYLMISKGASIFSFTCLVCAVQGGNVDLFDMIIDSGFGCFDLNKLLMVPSTFEMMARVVETFNVEIEYAMDKAMEHGYRWNAIKYVVQRGVKYRDTLIEKALLQNADQDVFELLVNRYPEEAFILCKYAKSLAIMLLVQIARIKQIKAFKRRLGNDTAQNIVDYILGPVGPEVAETFPKLWTQL